MGEGTRTLLVGVSSADLSKAQAYIPSGLITILEIHSMDTLSE